MLFSTLYPLAMADTKGFGVILQTGFALAFRDSDRLELMTVRLIFAHS